MKSHQMLKNYFLCVTAFLLVGGWVKPVVAVDLVISCGSVGQDYEMCKKATSEWSAKTGNKVSLFSVPNSSTDMLALIRQQFREKSKKLDVVMIDIVWPGGIKEHLIDLRPYSKGVENKHFPVMVANNTVDGKLIAMPWFTDAGLLYYRKDLLEKYQEKVPASWEELTDVALRIQTAEREAGNKTMNGFVFQGKAYEGLTCDALEWVSSYKGGSVVEKDGRISVNNPRAAKALDMAASWVGRISPKNVIEFGEEEARGVFQNGDSVFMRNWSYAWSLSQKEDSKVKGKVGVTALPIGGARGQHTATLGGWQLAVSKYSEHPDEAVDLLLYLTSAEVQKQRAIEASYNPTIPRVYSDTAVLKTTPFFDILYGIFIGAEARPSSVVGEKYNEVSSAFWSAAYSTISGKTSGAESVKKLENDLILIRQGSKW